MRLCAREATYILKERNVTLPPLVDPALRDVARDDAALRSDWLDETCLGVATVEGATPRSGFLLGPLESPGRPWRSLSAQDCDTLGYPAVQLEIANTKKSAFGNFSAAHINDNMAIVLNGEIATLASINSELRGTFIITGGAGGFTQKEVNNLVSVLKSGSLRVKPELQDSARVGASLGQDYINTGAISMAVAVGVIILFMPSFR